MTEIIALQTDYCDEGRVEKLKEKLYALSPGCEIYDAVHCLEKGDFVAASTGVYSALQFYPEGSIYFSDVSDGKKCRLCAAKTKDGHFIVTPDNGTLTAWYNSFGLAEVREVESLEEAAAIIALDPSNFEKTGKKYPVDDVVLITAEPPVVSDGFVECSMFSIVKGFGNLNLNVTYEEFGKSGIVFGDHVSVVLKDGNKTVFEAPDVLYAKSFGYVEPKKPVLFNGSTGYMGFGLNIDNFVSKYMGRVYTQDNDLKPFKMTFRKV